MEGPTELPAPMDLPAEEPMEHPAMGLPEVAMEPPVAMAEDMEVAVPMVLLHRDYLRVCI